MDDKPITNQPDIAESSGTAAVPRKQDAQPVAEDIDAPAKVWETEGSADPSGRVADVGGAGGTHSMPYDVEKASDVIGGQTNPDKGKA
ncbi:hypothetical protein EPK99_12190 [Neorhizobium lilium]|uniref:Uncharacterized protein n=1 Tax=Neorhizobium lilium TaxID=2503024 RepID=A0A3S3T0S5_9HYPH|nr:hypothetical protein [Neorhizobium lilium]RWX79302.1 hypothetical protein EPK99_12190 [Neorhizobium lilium]